MARFYSKEQRALQQRFETEKMANLLVQALVHPEIQDAERAFIESRHLFFLATVDGDGQPTCSYKGGDPGFVRVIDPATLAFPSYDGNGMFLSRGNVRARRPWMRRTRSWSSAAAPTRSCGSGFRGCS